MKYQTKMQSMHDLSGTHRLFAGIAARALNDLTQDNEILSADAWLWVLDENNEWVSSLGLDPDYWVSKVLGG